MQSGFAKAFKDSSQAIDRTARATDTLNRDLRDTHRIVSGILISQAFYGGVNAIERVTSSIVTFMGEMEKAQIALETFLGTPERATGFLETMKQFAAETSFNTDQALSLSRRLMGAQFDPSGIKNVMEILNDASAAAGGTTEQMDRIVLALTQVKTQGKLAGQEMRQFAEAGIPIYQIISEQMGIAKEQLKNIGNLQIDGDKAVIAILQGLEKRYKGTADRIAETVPGLWETIKDDFLFLSNAIFQTPYKAMQVYLRDLRDGMEKAREIFSTKGLGGVFEAFVPKDLQPAIRMVIGSIQSLVRSVGRFREAISPAVKEVTTSFLYLTSAVLPAVTSVINVISYLTLAAMQNIPGLKYLVSAILGLMVANGAARALALLWTVTRTGVIASAVAVAVRQLYTAIKALMLLVTRNPLVAVLMLIAGAILYVAMSSKQAAAWLDNLTAKLGNLAGFNIDDVLAPEDKEGYAEWTKEFNKELEGMQDDLSGVGEEAKKAGKKVKDTFLASFDEVFNIPDKLDDLQDNLDDVGDIKMPNMPGMPDMPNPNMPDNPMGDIDTGDGPFGAIGKAMRKFGQRWKDFWDGPMDAVYQFSGAFAANLALSAQNLANWVLEGKYRVADWVTGTLKSLQGWSVGAGQTVADWVMKVLENLNYLDIRMPSVFSGLAGSLPTIADWVEDVLNKLNEWEVRSEEVLAQWSAAWSATFGEWAANAAAPVFGWASGTLEAVRSWTVETAAGIAAWSGQTAVNLATFGVNAINTFKQWTKNTAGNIASWAATGVSNAAIFTVKTAGNIKAWAIDTSRAVGAWVLNTGTNFSIWAESAIQATGSFARAAGQNIANWVTSSAGNVLAWTNNVLQNFGAFANGGAKLIGSWAKATFGIFGQWMSGVAESFGNWMRNMLGGLYDWAMQAAKIIKGVHMAMGETIKFAIENPGSTWNSVKKSTGEYWQANKNWIVPVGIGLAAVGVGAAIVMSGGTAAPAALPLLALEKGGVVDKEQMIRIGEKNRREVVIPMQNPNFMKPFSTAVANDLIGFMKESGLGGGSSSQEQQPILYVGNLIADESSLRELERRMRVVRMSERDRGVRDV